MIFQVVGVIVTLLCTPSKAEADGKGQPEDGTNEFDGPPEPRHEFNDPRMGFYVTSSNDYTVGPTGGNQAFYLAPVSDNGNTPFVSYWCRKLTYMFRVQLCN